MSENEEEKEEDEEALLKTKPKRRKWVKYDPKAPAKRLRAKGWFYLGRYCLKRFVSPLSSLFYFLSFCSVLSLILVSPAVPRKRKKEVPQTDQSYEPRNLRKSTIDLGQLTLERERLRTEELKMKRKYSRKSSKKTPVLTQEQLLEEAKKTEVENLASLEAYARMEAQKKTYKIKDHTISGPAIRYHSVTMPAVERDGGLATEKYSRNFLIFTDTTTIPTSIFPTEKPTKPKSLYCKVTGLPAKYIDPLTKFPYSTAQAFKVIRDRYVKEKEEKCEERLQQLSDWLEEKKRLKIKQTR